MAGPKFAHNEPEVVRTTKLNQLAALASTGAVGELEVFLDGGGAVPIDPEVDLDGGVAEWLV